VSDLYVDVTGNVTGLPTSDRYGMAIAKANRRVTYSTLDVTWNQVDFFEIPGGGDVWKDYPAIAGREVLAVQIMIDPPPLNRRAIAHTVDVNGTVMHVAGGSERTYILVLMR
jgi:hypothetical protein